MTDLVKRLRDLNFGFEYDGPDGLSAIIAKYDHLMCLAAEAASALESLTAENAALKAELDESRKVSNLGCDARNGGPHTIMSDGSYKFCSACGETIKNPALQERARAAEARTATLLQQRNEAFERAASWHDHQAELVMNSLHCGDSVPTIAAARRKADWHTESAAAIRNLSKES